MLANSSIHYLADVLLATFSSGLNFVVFVYCMCDKMSSLLSVPSISDLWLIVVEEEAMERG